MKRLGNLFTTIIGAIIIISTLIFIYKGKKFWEGNNEDIMRSENKELNDFVFASRWMKAVKKQF